MTDLSTQSRRRFYIALQTKPYRPGRREVWPILFKTYEEAQSFAERCNPFRGKNSSGRPALPDGRRIISFTINVTLLPKRKQNV